jgi:adenylate cyclase
VLVAQQCGLRSLARQELASLDFLFRLRGARAPSPDIVILAIDQRSMVADTFTSEELAANPQLALLKNFPFPRRVYGDAFEKLCRAGAKVVAFDLLFLSPKDDDEILRAAIAKHRDRVVIGSNFSDDGNQLMLPSVVVPETIPTESVAGYVNYWPDSDDTLRRAQPQARSRIDTSASQSFDALVGERFGKPRATDTVLINFVGPSGTFPSHPFYELFYDRAWRQNLQSGAAFRDKIVLIGPAGNFQHDQHPTPFGPMDGVEIHANAIATLLHGDAPREVTSWLGFGAICLLALLTAALLTLVPNPLLKIAALVGLGAAYFGIAAIVFTHRGVALTVAAPLWTVAGGGALGITMQFVLEQLEKRRVRQTLERYVSKPVADEILRRGEQYQQSLLGERRAVTILFSDIRDFTSISEQSDAAVLVEQLNEYFTAMVEIVMQHDGTLSKFIGDAIMALYGAPLSKGATEDAAAAVATAQEMRERLAELQQRWAAQGRPILKIGIGINHGEVIVGDVGSPQRREYTVIGDPVNVASRVEGLNKEFGTDILLTESVYKLVKDRVAAKLMGSVAVKGRGQKLNVYGLLRTESKD